MKASTTLHQQANSQSARPLHPNFPCQPSRGTNFKTSNPQIFPSLHPFSGFYRERNSVLPKPAFPTPKTIGLETVKKVKADDTQYQNVIRNTLCEQVLNIVEKKEQETTQLSIREERQRETKNDDFEFRIPKRPTRLSPEDRRQVEEARKQSEIFGRASVTSTAEQSSMNSDEVTCQKIHVPQAKRNGFVRRSTYQPVKQTIQSTQPDAQIVTVPKVVPVVQNQLQQEVLGVENMLKTLYDNLKMEYISIQLQRNAQHLFQILQQNQDAFSKNLRTPFEMLQKEGLDIEEDTDCTSDKSSDEGIKEENIKQEIQC